MSRIHHHFNQTLQGRDATREPSSVRYTLLGIALLFFVSCLLLPLILVFVEAFRQGIQVFSAALFDHNTLAAVKLTLLTAAIAVPINVVFGIAAAWSVAKFQFKGKTILTTLIDLPFSVSPVIAGLMLVLLFGTQGWWGNWLQQHDIQILYAVPAIVLREIWIAGEIRAELQDQDGQLIEISLTPEQSKQLNLQPQQTVWVTASNIHIFDAKHYA